MEVKLDVLVSTSIKQRKPWTRITWIGQVSVKEAKGSHVL